MKGFEKISINHKNVAFIIRSDTNVKNGIHFFSKPKDTFQFALHKYNSRKITHIHSNKVSKPLVLKSKQKYIYIVEGSAIVELITKIAKSDILKKIPLRKGDGIIIMDTLHRVIFAKGSKAIEIKQGPYGEND